MMLIVREVDDSFDFTDLKYDVKVKVGTDGLKDIKINQINMLMQQAGNLMEMQAVPPQVIGMLFAELAETMDRPDIARAVETYQPQPDPMAQAMSEAQLAQAKANAAKDAALAENAMARTALEKVKAQKEAAGSDAEVAGKYADVAKKMADIDIAKADTVIKAQQAMNKNQGSK
jgi:multidrug efflux pump subunit AcrA (membrane-fusion protein)